MIYYRCKCGTRDQFDVAPAACDACWWCNTVPTSDGSEKEPTEHDFSGILMDDVICCAHCGISQESFEQSF